MRTATRVSLFGFFLAGMACAQAQIVTLPSRTLADFKKMQGVNVHLEYSDGKYADINQVIADMRYLGISHARDGYPIPGFWASIGVPDIEQAMDSGITFDLIAGNQFASCSSPSNSPGCLTPINTAQIDALASHHPGGITSVEGLNEINNQSNPPISESQAEAIQFSLYAATKADSHLQGVPVLDFTGLADHT